MGIIRSVVRALAVRVNKQIEFMAQHPQKFQDAIFTNIINKGKQTKFGKEHNFKSIKTYEDFKRAVPIQVYEDYKHYIDEIIAGESDVLWPGKPKYILGTSGTTSGVKYLPLSKESLPYHFNTARNAVFNYTLKYGLLKMFDGKLLYLSGSPELTKKGEYLSGRLSGIVNHEIPRWLRFNQIPSLKTNSIPVWEEKIQGIIDESINEDLTMISGIPPWALNYYENLLERAKTQTVREVFPNLSVFVHGGVNFEPYKPRFMELTGGEIDCIETYPSTEGFVAFQDVKGEAGMLLNVNGGVFFEFVPVDEIFDENPTRLRLKDVELHKPYAIILTNNAGIYASRLGDVVEFVSNEPYRLIIKGRVEHFISAFGEHVIAKEVETAMREAIEETGITVYEYTVAPEINTENGTLPYHEWFIEVDNVDINTSHLQEVLNESLMRQNFQYADLVNGKIIQPLVIKKLPKGSFYEYLKSVGKFGGQNKIPRLSNDRKLVTEMMNNLNLSGSQVEMA